MKLIELQNRMGGHSKRSNITKIARHHSATSSGDVRSFERHWRNKGWKTGGYHEIIKRNGDVQICYDHDVVTNGVYGHNQTTYHICLVGNGDFTNAQEKAFKKRAKHNMERFGLSVNDVLGHNEFSGTNTSCPGVNMDSVRNGLGEKQTSSNLLKNGDKGQKVKDLQNDLLAVGEKLTKYGADSHFGDETEKAVKSFQKSAGITVDGLVGSETRQALQQAQDVDLPNGVYKRGNRSEAVEKIQRALDKVNFKPGAIDGIYGEKTEDAVRRFQKVYLPHEVDGIYGDNTKAKLEEVM